VGRIVNNQQLSTAQDHLQITFRSYLQFHPMPALQSSHYTEYFDDKKCVKQNGGKGSLLIA
jgi:hypothetical protein